MDSIHKATAFAAKQEGVIHRDQALVCGATERQIDHRIRHGLWRRLHPGVYLISPAALTFEARCRAALLALGSPAALTGSTAAHLLGLIPREPSGPIEAAHDRRIRRSGIRVYLDREAGHYPRVSCRGFPITPLKLVVVFAARSCAEAELHRVIQEARKMGLRPERLQHAIDRLCGNGVPGTKALRRRISAVVDLAPTDSVLEDLLLPHLLRRSLKPQLQAPIVINSRFMRRGDFVFFDVKIDAETDGRDAHSGDQFDRDRRIDRVLLENGWIVPRYTWRDVTEDPEGAADDLAGLVRSRSLKLL